MLRFLIAASIVLNAWSVVLADPPTVDLKALTAAGNDSAHKLLTTPASCDVRITFQSGMVFGATTIIDGKKTRTDVSVQGATQQVTILNLIQRDGFWYTVDVSGSSKYRPYEYPAETPAVYMALDFSKPIFVTSETQLARAKLESIDGQVATFRQTLDPALDKEFQGIVGQMEQVERQDAKALSPLNKIQLAEMKDAIAHGMAKRVDLTTGQIIEFGLKPQVRVDKFQFLAKADDAAFAVDETHWQDCSDDPTLGNLDDLIMISHDPDGRAHGKGGDIDGRIMDVKTGRFRRIPFRGFSVLPWCFCKDRRYVLVSGMNMESAALRPYQVDLKTGQCRPLGGALLNEGATLMGDVSPDGTTAVSIHLDPAAGGNLLQSQPCLIDLKTGNAKPLGKRMDTAFLNWTADGKHLILLNRQGAGALSPTARRKGSPSPRPAAFGPSQNGDEFNRIQPRNSLGESQVIVALAHADRSHFDAKPGIVSKGCFLIE